MSKKKFYVVWKGKKKGVFSTWDECKKSIDGFKGAEYKAFPDLATATKASEKTYVKYKGVAQPKVVISAEKRALIGNPILNTIAVDAACSRNPGLMEYQGVETKSKKVIFKKGPYKNSTNNIGEFLALVHALALLKRNNNASPIYSDSKIAIGWVKRKRVNTKLLRNAANEDSFELIDRALKWLHTNDYPNKILKWETKVWGEIPADFGRK
ncbi:ribonuclease H family protein [Vicingaceae bacterium]|nr:ribonuclease H family protein [Vicingaceae bacterium]MDB4062085.1 ribonuclease H family protein [Vicingaceae bacterium]MDC1452022.1 ribonuclease H family protein [Vicingaceae bacterium]